jgi:putative PEP-CTERM system TPR-repeat lipoprotein
LYTEIKEYDKALALSETMIKQFPKRAEGHRLQGFVHFFKQQYIDAIPALQRSLVLQPNSGACYVLGLSHYYRNEAEQALNQFQKALDINPSMTQARVHLALVLLNKKRTDDAIREVKTVLSQDDRNALAHNVLGSAYLTKGNYAEGIAELNKALELDPSLADVHIKKGLVAMKRGRGEEAEAELAAAVRLKPEKQDARRILALYYLNRNEPAKAIDVLRKGMQGGSPDAVSYYLMGESYLRKNDLNEARTYFTKAKEADPKYDLAYFRLASIHFMQEKQEEGVKEIRSLLEHSPDNVQALLLLASLAEANSDENEARKNYLAAADTGKTEGIIAAALYLQRTNDIDKALTILNEGIKRSSADVRLHEVKGRILLANRKFKDALVTFEAIDRLNPQLGPGYLVNAYLAMGEQAKALERVQTEIRKNPTNLGLRAELSRIYVLMGNKTEAMENARDIIRKNPESPVGYVALALVHESGNDVEKGIEVLRSAPKSRDAALTFTLGNLYARKKNYPAALEQYQRAEKMNAGSDQVLFQKGNILYAMGRKKEAGDEYQKVLRLFPNHAMALNNLAYLYIEENRNPSQALLYATRAFMLAPQNDSIQDTLGYVLLKNGRTEQGLSMLRKASESSPKNPGILYHLALAYKERGDQAKAVEQLQKALALGDFPEARDAKALLAKIRKGGNS